MKSYFLPLLSLLFLTSCFEVIEEVSIKTDKSGKFSYIINLSQSRNEISTAQKVDTFMGGKIPSNAEIQSRFAEFKSNLEKQEGISGVQLKEDYDNYIFELVCQFTTVEKLQNALTKTFTSMGLKKEGVLEFGYSYADSTFERKTGYIAEANIQKMKDLMGKSASNAKYSFVLRNENGIKSINNSLGKISPSGKSMRIGLTGNDILLNTHSGDVKAILKL